MKNQPKKLCAIKLAHCGCCLNTNANIAKGYNWSQSQERDRSESDSHLIYGDCPLFFVPSSSGPALSARSKEVFNLLRSGVPVASLSLIFRSWHVTNNERSTIEAGKTYLQVKKTRTAGDLEVDWSTHWGPFINYVIFQGGLRGVTKVKGGGGFKVKAWFLTGKTCVLEQVYYGTLYFFRVAFSTF